MSNDGKEITMLAQYNIDLTSNIQSSNAGAISFSMSTYWLYESNNLKLEYKSGYI